MLESAFWGTLVGLLLVGLLWLPGLISKMSSVFHPTPVPATGTDADTPTTESSTPRIIMITIGIALLILGIWLVSSLFWNDVAGFGGVDSLMGWLIRAAALGLLVGLFVAVRSAYAENAFEWNKFWAIVAQSTIGVVGGLIVLTSLASLMEDHFPTALLTRIIKLDAAMSYLWLAVGATYVALHGLRGSWDRASGTIAAVLLLTPMIVDGLFFDGADIEIIAAASSDQFNSVIVKMTLITVAALVATKYAPNAVAMAVVLFGSTAVLLVFGAFLIDSIFGTQLSAGLLNNWKGITGQYSSELGLTIKPLPSATLGGGHQSGTTAVRSPKVTTSQVAGPSDAEKAGLVGIGLIKDSTEFVTIKPFCPDLTPRTFPGFDDLCALYNGTVTTGVHYHQGVDLGPEKAIYMPADGIVYLINPTIAAAKAAGAMKSRNVNGGCIVTFEQKLADVDVLALVKQDMGLINAYRQQSYAHRGVAGEAPPYRCNV